MIHKTDKSTPLITFVTMSDTKAWEEYCEASLDLSNQDDVGDYKSFDTVEELLEDLHDE